jgi:plasmid stabilization system protein ParE
VKLIWSDRALARLAQIHDDVAAEQPAAAKRIVRRIGEAAEILRMYPGVGRPIRRPRMRVFAAPGTKYLLLFRVEQDNVTVASIFHGAEDWSSQIRQNL